jgi:nucleoside-diphosphate-sugar epimerase
MLRASVTAGEQQRSAQERAGAAVDSPAMKVLVTGASGFVGRALVEELRHGERAYEVLPLGREDGDLADEGVAERAISEGRPDVVVHAAARIGVVRCEEEPELALRSNVLATIQVSRACSTHSARLAYISTTDIYGPAVMADEETRPAPQSLYTVTKLWGEQVARLYAPDALLILRLASPYGPGVEPGQGKGALPNMLDQARRGERIPVFHGETRTWCWIGDVVRGIRLVLESGEEGVFDVGSDADPVSMIDAASLACAITGAPEELIDEIEPPPGRVSPQISVDRLRALGWQPEVGLEDGLRLTLEAWQAAPTA